MEKKSTIHGTSVSYDDSTHENNSRENMYTRHNRSIFMVNKDSAHQQHMYYCDLSIFMINKDGSLSTNTCLVMTFPELFAMNTRTKKQNGWKDAWAYRPRAKELKTCLSPPMRVANKLTPEPILRCFNNQGKSQMPATSRTKQKAEKEEAEDTWDPRL